jgi:LuxR family maltose regulon positive regulatory protein
VNEFPIQESKVQRPPLRDATLRRDRLLDWLHAKIHHRVVFVTAEAGYGKTTLLSDFARRTRLRTLWYRLDEEDRDWISLLNYLVAAGRQVEPAFAPGTHAMLREIGTGGPGREAIVDTFIHELGLFGTAGAVLIVDDYHLIDDVPDVRAVMREIVARAPERLTIVFLSRRRPTIPLARIRALGELVELRATDLRFDESETEQLFREAYGTPLEPDVLADLTRRTEGWAASLQLVQAAIRDRSTSEIRAFVKGLTGAQAELHDYLAEEVVGELDPNLQAFLMRTSILQVVDPELASVAAGIDETTASAHISAAEEIGLLPPHGGAKRAGRRYHPLVRGFLEARLRRDIGAAGIRDLHRSVARFAEGWSWRLAAHHFSDAGDSADLHRVIAGATRTILGSGDFALAESYLDRFPPPEPHPMFDLVRSRMELDRAQVPAALDRARAAFAAFPPDSADPDSNLALANLLSVEYSAGNLEMTSQLASKLISRQPDPSLLALATGTHLLLTSSTVGDLSTHVEYLRRMADDHLNQGLQHYFGITQLNIASAARAQGRAEEALSAATLAIDALRASSASFQLPAAHMARAWGLAHLGRWEEGMKELQTALATPHGPARVEALQEAADIHTWYGDVEEGRRLHQDALQAGVPVGDDWRVSAAQTLVRQGDLATAARHLRESQIGALSPECGHQARHLTVLAQLAVARSDPGAARRILEARRHATAQGAGFWMALGRLLAGVAGSSDELNEEVVFVGEVDSAMLSVAADHLVTRLSDLKPSAFGLVTAEASRRPDRWRAALRRMVGDDNSTSQLAAGRLLDAVGTVQDVPPLRALARTKGRSSDIDLGRRLARHLAPRVYVEDQGRVSIMIGDQLVPGTDVRRKVLSLLCFLLTRIDMSATRDQVLEALWPELEPDVAGNSLNQTVYFLRRVFDPAYRDDVSPEYVHHKSDVLWLDSELVVSRSHVCRALMRRAGATGDPADVQAVSETYAGRFALDFAYEEWAAPFRDSLHAAYLEIVERAISQDINSGHFERGIALARRAMEVDPDAEHLELALLRLYRLTGAHSAAAEQYAHYSAMVREELGIEPPPLESL